MKATQDGADSTKNRWTVGWGTSSRCDLHCPFCYSAEARKSHFQLSGHIEQARSFLAYNHDKIQNINFGTGEPFLDDDFLTLVKDCSRIIPEAKIAVTTNGALAAMRRRSYVWSQYDELIDELDVSIDFAAPASHDSWRGVGGTWVRALDAVSVAKEIGAKPTIVIIGMPETLSEENLLGVLDIAAFFQAALRINFFMPVSHNCEYLPSPNEVWRALALVNEHSTGFMSSDRLIAAQSRRFGAGSNLAEYRSCRILPSGSVSPSTYLLADEWLTRDSWPMVDLSTVSRSKPFKRYLQAPIPSECLACDLVASCRGGSIERRWLITGTLTMRDPLCDREQHTSCRRDDSSLAVEDFDTPSVHLDYLPTTVIPKPRTTGQIQRYVKGLVISHGKVLMVKEINENGNWKLPGGRCLPGELPNITLGRELTEELGMHASMPNETPELRWASNVDGRALLGSTFVVPVDEQRVTLSAEHKRCDWIHPTELEDRLRSASLSDFQAARCGSIAAKRIRELSSVHPVLL